MRGDRPLLPFQRFCLRKFTPHARGSTPLVIGICATFDVYPACAGIDLLPALVSPSFLCLPRMRGDRPRVCGFSHYFFLFTPHARGSTTLATAILYLPLVYPACAGIDLSIRKFLPAPHSLPRMRGDRPER